MQTKNYNKDINQQLVKKFKQYWLPYLLEPGQDDTWLP